MSHESSPECSGFLKDDRVQSTGGDSQGAVLEQLRVTQMTILSLDPCSTVIILKNKINQNICQLLGGRHDFSILRFEFKIMHR